jgi:hypothetical protein
MKILSTHLNQRGLMIIVASFATCWLLASPGASAAEKKSSPAPTQQMKAPGRLVIVRSATLGPTVVGLRVDGVQVAQITYTRRYDAPIAAGSHVITVYPVHSMQNARPRDRQINVESGRTYTFTAARQDVDLVLK